MRPAPRGSADPRECNWEEWNRAAGIGEIESASGCPNCLPVRRALHWPAITPFPVPIPVPQTILPILQPISHTQSQQSGSRVLLRSPLIRDLPFILPQRVQCPPNSSKFKPSLPIPTLQPNSSSSSTDCVVTVSGEMPATQCHRPLFASTCRSSIIRACARRDRKCPVAPPPPFSSV
jgi:hypothetical protein